MHESRAWVSIFRQRENKAENGSDYPSVTLSTVFLTDPWCIHYVFPSLSLLWRKMKAFASLGMFPDVRSASL